MNTLKMVKMDIALLVIFIIKCHGLENLALGKHADMSSTRYHDKWLAAAAVDGVKNQSLESGTCAHTSIENKPVAWWRVDLGSVSSILNVTIFYRMNSAGNPLTYRLRGMRVEVTDDLDSKWNECHRYRLSGWPPTVSTVPCSASGRYLRLYQNKTDTCRAPLVNMDNCAILELCEVLVYGHKGVSFVCPDRCLENKCKAGSEECLACVPGFNGPLCDKRCKTGYHGSGCRLKCQGKCRGGMDKCDNVDGTCSMGCADGWMGDKCDKPETHNQNASEIKCDEPCSVSFEMPRECDDTNGTCQNNISSSPSTIKKTLVIVVSGSALLLGVGVGVVVKYKCCRGSRQMNSIPVQVNTVDEEGRHVNEDGLIYVDVSVVNKKKPKQKKPKKKQETEYACVVASPYSSTDL